MEFVFSISKNSHEKLQTLEKIDKRLRRRLLFFPVFHRHLLLLVLSAQFLHPLSRTFPGWSNSEIYMYITNNQLEENLKLDL